MIDFFIASIFLSWKVKKRGKRRKTVSSNLDWPLLCLKLMDIRSLLLHLSEPIASAIRGPQGSLGWKIPPPGQALAQSRNDFRVGSGYWGLLNMFKSWLLNIFKGGESITFLGNLCQAFTPLTLQKVFSLYPARTILAAACDIWLRCFMLHKTNILLKHRKGKGFFVIVQSITGLYIWKAIFLLLQGTLPVALQHRPARFSPQG